MADLIIKGALVLTRNSDNEVISDAAVAVTGSEITEVGAAREIESRHGNGARVIDSPKGLIMPGLVNAHTHVSMTCFRGLADDLPLMTWLQDHIFPAEAKLTAEIVYWGALLGCAEMIMSGTTSFCDMYLFEREVARAADQAGLRALVGEVLYDFPSPNYGPPEKGLTYTEDLAREYRSHPLVSVAVEPHALYTCSPDLLKACGALAERLDLPLITHLSENAEEVSTVKEKYGLTPVRHLDSLGLLNSRLIADHCVVLDDEEIELMGARRVRVSHNPRSNMKLASGVAPVTKLRSAGAVVGLGTDGPASNNNLDMFQEMDMAAKLEKVFSGDPTIMDAQTVLNMATCTGAEVLGQGDRVGRLSAGYQADIIVLDLDRPHLTPLYNPVSHLVYSATGGDVTHTVVGGKVLMDNRRLTTLDLDRIFGEMDRIAGIMAEAVSGRNG